MMTPAFHLPLFSLLIVRACVLFFIFLSLFGRKKT
uniref:Uncharacterized protein n=1 Tax=Arundo donax TaxID=35708 RepID=A0A0A9A6W6_ARUDO